MSPGESPRECYDLAVAYLEMGVFEEAIEAFKESLEDESLFVAACSNVGLCYRKLHQPRFAAAWYRRGLEKTRAESREAQAMLYNLREALYEDGLASSE